MEKQRFAMPAILKVQDGRWNDDLGYVYIILSGLIIIL